MTTLSASARDFRTMGVIGIAHMFSHFYQFALAPLFWLMQPDLNVSFIQLGTLMTVLFVTSGLLQTPAGFLVDRIGARPVLLTGLFLMSASTAAYGFAPGYKTLFALSIIAGIGNSVFHPADYSLLNATIRRSWLGRAYSVHSIGGYIGFGLAPVLTTYLAAGFGWRAATIAIGLVGIAFSLGLLAWRHDPVAEGLGDDRASAPGDDGIGVLLRPQILLSFAFFVVLAMGLIGLQSFTTTALVERWSVSLETAGVMLSLFLFATPAGILAGGIAADRVTSHDSTAGVAFIFSGLAVLVIPLFSPGEIGIAAALLASGLLFGFGLPSRDLFIRSMTPAGSSGRVFGFVYGGLDTGAAITPVVFGFFMDMGRPAWIFVFSGLFILGSSAVVKLTSLVARRRSAQATASGTGA